MRENQRGHTEPGPIRWELVSGPHERVTRAVAPHAVGGARSEGGQAKRVTAIHNGGTADESNVLETGDPTWPFAVRTPRGNWRCSDLLPALYVANVAGRGVPRRPVVLHDGPARSNGQPIQ